ncbi:MAG: wax ester/triacylglycerol synthase family O-acyltransferase [Lysobacterales bacterium]|jgi:WS/DGAT/MGAT family acyltransferase|nr:MAG: wax ester/triacylglycerol synthase family O-acyltransferase [Xanthomonadales bacterium]
MSTPIPMLDLMFFLTETVDNPRHVGSVLVFRKPKRGGGRTVQQIVDAYLAAKPLPPFNRIPVFRRPGLPVWEDASRIDMAHHVLHLALPAPGSNEQLHRLVADLHAPMLERHRPGWKVYVIDGLADGRFALYHKCHHALVDGESGMRILRQSLSESAADRRIRTTVGLAHPHRPRPAPRGLQERLEREARQLAGRSYSVGRGSLHALNQALGGLRGYSPRQPRAFTAPHTPMNDPIYNARSISHAVLPLDRMQRVARAWGATVNDVTLCVLDAGINRYLRRHGAAPDHPIVALCPVSLHDPGAKDVTTNVSAIFPALGPVSASIGKRLQTIMEHTRAAKAELKGLGKNVAYAYAVVAFAISETLTVASPEALGLVPANVLVSNVRGPEQPLYLNGARLEALFPVSTLIVGIGLNVTFMSYAGQVILGFTANGSALPEVESLARDATAAFVGLERVTAQRGTPRAPARGKTRRRARATA